MGINSCGLYFLVLISLLQALRHDPTRWLRSGLWASGDVCNGNREHPRRDPLPAIPWPRRVLGYEDFVTCFLQFLSVWRYFGNTWIGYELFHLARPRVVAMGIESGAAIHWNGILLGLLLVYHLRMDEHRCLEDCIGFLSAWRIVIGQRKCCFRYREKEFSRFLGGVCARFYLKYLCFDYYCTSELCVSVSYSPSLS